MKDYVVGLFKKELKGRFLGLIEVNGIVEECLIPSSSPLRNYIKFDRAEVLLTKNKARCRTRYTLEAVKIAGKFVFVNLQKVNELLYKRLILTHSIKLVKREYRITKRLRADIVVMGRNSIVYEAKTILTNKEKAIFPQKSGERAVRQLEEIKGLLKAGWGAKYCLFVLNSGSKTIMLAPNEEKYVKEFMACLRIGMQVEVYRVKFNGKDFRLRRDNLCASHFLEGIGLSDKS